MRKLNIEISIENKVVPLSSYSAQLVGYNDEPTAPELNTFTAVRGIRQNVDDKNISYVPDNVTLSFKITSQNHEKTDYLMRKLMAELLYFDFKLSSQSYWHTFVQTSVERKWIDYEREVIVTLRGTSYCWMQPNRLSVLETSQDVWIESPRPTPLSFIIVAKENIENIKINDFTILSMKKGQQLVIDSFYCRVTIDGQNAMEQLEIYEFPIVKGAYHIDISDNSNIDVMVEWRQFL